MRRAHVLVLLYLATFSVVAVSLARGADYYRAPLAARLRHPQHWELKPGGELGLTFGIAGATLMVAMLSYSVRRRAPALRKAGRLSAWLDFHIWCGVTGPLLVVLHSSFKVGGLIAIAFWCMVAVALSGIFGRFLYAQLPRSAAGVELSLEEARRLEVEITERLRSQLELPPSELALLESAGAPRDPSTWRAFGALVAARGSARRRVAEIRRRHPAVSARTGVRLANLAQQRAQLHLRLALWRRLHELFHYWHVIHRPFSLLMYIFVAVHVTVAYLTGYAGGLG